MMRRLLGVATATVMATAGLTTASTTAQAAPPDTAAADQTEEFTPAQSCSTGAITDVVDGTANVYGGGWISCNFDAYEIAVTVTLYRNGSPVAAHLEVCSPARGCSSSVQITDSWAGSQRWQTLARFQGPVNTTRSSNILNH